MTAGPGTFILRRATVDDAAACAAVHHGSWVETYANLLPEEHWRSDTLECRTATWRDWLSGDGVVLVAVRDGTVIGIAHAGAAQQVGDHPPVRDQELRLLYVLAEHHGSGVGQELLDAVLGAHVPAQLWVAEQNPRARRFYARNGFVPDGVRHVDPDLGLAEVRLVR